MKKSRLSTVQINVMLKVNSGGHLSASPSLRNPFFSGKEQLIQPVSYNTFKSLVERGFLYKTEVESGEGRCYFLATEIGKTVGI